MYRQRDLRLLQHMGAYEISIPAAVSQVFFKGKPSGHVLRRLADEKLLQLMSRRLEGGLSFYRLTEQGAKRVGIPSDRATESIGVQSLDKAIAVLVWCTLGDKRRFRLERCEVEAVFGVKLPTNQVHVVEYAAMPAIYRVSLVQGSHEPVIKVLRRDVEKATGGLEHAIAARHYGFVLLVDSHSKQRVLESAVLRSGLRDVAEIRVELAATAKSIAAYLRGLRKADK
jgi:hypothetical protein